MCTHFMTDREANFSGFWFIAINDKFGPIYIDKFDKKASLLLSTLPTKTHNWTYKYWLQNATCNCLSKIEVIASEWHPIRNGKKKLQNSLEIHNFP